MKYTHEGHRARLSGKVKEGVALYDHETLEVLLFNACPRRNLNATAHALLDRFGDLYGVMHASEEELCSVEGVGKNIAEYICCLSAVLENINDCESFAELKSTFEFLNYVRADRSLKCGLNICLVEKDGRVRRKLWIPFSPDGTAPLNKFYAWLSVSHPYGIFVCSLKGDAGCAPTSADDGTAERVAEAAGLCGVRFFDYCILGEGGDTYSYFVENRSVFGGKAKPNK